MKLEEFLKQVRSSAQQSGIVLREETLLIGPTKAKVRFHLINGSYIDVFVNVVLDKQYYHWQKLDGKIYRVNNYPAEGWHEHIETEERKRPFRRITPQEFFTKVKEELSKRPPT